MRGSRTFRQFPIPSPRGCEFRKHHSIKGCTSPRKALESNTRVSPRGSIDNWTINNINNIKCTNLMILQVAAFHLHPALAGDLQQRELMRGISQKWAVPEQRCLSPAHVQTQCGSSSQTLGWSRCSRGIFQYFFYSGFHGWWSWLQECPFCCEKVAEVTEQKHTGNKSEQLFTTKKKCWGRFQWVHGLKWARPQGSSTGGYCTCKSHIALR